MRRTDVKVGRDYAGSTGYGIPNPSSSQLQRLRVLDLDAVTTPQYWRRTTERGIRVQVLSDDGKPVVKDGEPWEVTVTGRKLLTAWPEYVRERTRRVAARRRAARLREVGGVYEGAVWKTAREVLGIEEYPDPVRRAIPDGVSTSELRLSRSTQALAAALGAEMTCAQRGELVERMEAAKRELLSATTEIEAEYEAAIEAE